jgi:S1-C subfamily serine protease
MNTKDCIAVAIISVCIVFGAAFAVVDLGFDLTKAITTVSAEPNLSDAMDCVVHIKSGRYEGSGAIISADGIVLTARHVLEGADANGFTVTLRNGLTYRTTTSYASPQLGPITGPDVGFLKVDYYHPTRYLSLEPDRPKLGDDVWCMGHPFGEDGAPWSITRGIVSSLAQDCDGAYGPGPMLQIDAAAYPGNSGGPVLNDQGRVVGVLVGAMSGCECLSMCVPAERAADWLEVFRSMLEARL